MGLYPPNDPLIPETDPLIPETDPLIPETDPLIHLSPGFRPARRRIARPAAIRPVYSHPIRVNAKLCRAPPDAAGAAWESRGRFGG